MVETGNQIVNGRLMVDAPYWNSLWLVKGTDTLFGWLMAAAPYIHPCTTCMCSTYISTHICVSVCILCQLIFL